MRRSICLAAVSLTALGACTTAEPHANAGPRCRVTQASTTLPFTLDEASGAAVSRRYPGMIWTHNDGAGAELFGIDAAGRIVARVRLPDVAIEDLEDIALSECADGNDCLYLADIGDNAAKRSQIVIHRLPEPPPGAREARSAERFVMTYPGQPRDAEALIVLPGERVFIVSKGGDGAVSIYRYPGPLRSDSVIQLELVRDLSRSPVVPEDRVTGADASPSGAWIALRTQRELLFYRSSMLEGLDTIPFRIDLRALAEAQGEGIALGERGSVVLVSEGGGAGLPGSMGVLACDLPAR